MKLNFVRKNNDIYRAEFVGNHILELYEEKDKNGTYLKAYNFDVRKNTLTEIAPEIKKYKSVSIRNCIYNSDKFYFATYEEESDGIKFSVYRYNFFTDKTGFIFDFKEDQKILTASERLKIFVLDQSDFLIQTESIVTEKDSGHMGAISFKLRLYNSESKESLDVEIPDFINNGINNIIPVSKSRLVIKCGYSFAEDTRIRPLSESESLIESIYLTNTRQLIADISLNKTTGSMTLIDTAYFEKCILSLRASGDYILYDVSDVPKKKTVINFVNVNTLERFQYKKEYDEGKQSHFPLVICNNPYIRIPENEKEVFLNLANGLEDMEFVNEIFLCSAGNLLLFKKYRRKKEHLRIYSYPYLSLVYEEEFTFGNLCVKNDEYYIYSG